jgi:glycosyltransferase involved in cell wall biosynthesis
MTSPVVSVLVTVFNREPYLAACVESILASTYGDIEVILVDDASTDGSLDLAQTLASRDGRIRVELNTTNLGDYGNRGRAAQLATGRYLKYVDSDDLIYRHSLTLMVEAMESNPDAALGLSHSSPEEIEPYPWRLTPREAWLKEFLGTGCLGCGPSGAIIRRDRFFEAGGFGNRGILNDTDLWMRMSARWPIVLLPPGLVWWRRHGGQEFMRPDARAAYLEGGFRLAMDALSDDASPLNESETNRAKARVRQHHARRLWSLAARPSSPLAALRLFRQSGLGFSDALSGLRKYA